MTPSLDAGRCPNGHLTYPTHLRCPECGERQISSVDLSDRTAEVVTWTETTVTPPGVRAPNRVAIVEFEVEGDSVRALGQVADDEAVEIGDVVRPVYVTQLRDPPASMREPESQEWDGFQFEPV